MDAIGVLPLPARRPIPQILLRMFGRLSMDDSLHTFGQNCPTCGDGRSGVSCVHRRYGSRMRRFIQAHLEAFETAYLNPDRRSSSAEMSRLSREFETLPPRHDCWCVCPNVRYGRQACQQCQNLQRNQKPQEPPEFGRTSAVTAPMPSVNMLDFAAGLLSPSR